MEMTILQTGLVSLLISFLVVYFVTPRFIPMLKRLKFGQAIREEGPQSHLEKSGTPTMGGLVIQLGVLVAVVLLSVLIGNWDFFPLLVMLYFGAVGFIDDYIKVVLKRNLGLKAKQKLLGQIVIALLFSWLVTQTMGRGTELWIPGLDQRWDVGFLFHALVFFIIVGTTNAVNLTDGLDGLAAGTSVAAMGIYAGIAYYLGQLAVAGFFASVTGACLGFLVYNRHPAKIFMGDTGSLALGGALAAGAVLTRTELVLPLIGAIFVAEALSVIIQVISFKSTGRRVFRMSPLHHHFELGGWSETKVVGVFWLVGLVCGLLGLWVVLSSTVGGLK